METFFANFNVVDFFKSGYTRYKKGAGYGDSRANNVSDEKGDSTKVIKLKFY